MLSSGGEGTDGVADGRSSEAQLPSTAAAMDADMDLNRTITQSR